MTIAMQGQQPLTRGVIWCWDDRVIDTEPPHEPESR